MTRETEGYVGNDRLEVVGVSRRTVLQGVTAGAVVGLAGCTNGDDDDQPSGPVIGDPTEPDDGPHYEGSLESQRLGGYSMRALARRMDPVRQTDPVRTPNRLGGVPRSARENAPPNDPNEDDWHQGGSTAKNLAADFGLYHATNKGILDTHRGDPTSIGDVLNRHVGPNSTVHKVLAYNTWLVTLADDRDARAKEIGRMIGREGYDIAALSEVFNDDHAQDIYDHVDIEGHSDWDEAFGPESTFTTTHSSGLYGLVGGDDRSLESSDREAFSHPGTMDDRFAKKGWLHMEIDLGPGILDLYLTHANSGKGGRHVDPRHDQIEEMTDAISARQSTHPENVTMAVGDFNVYSGDGEYEQFLHRMWNTCGLRDAWLTRGGEASSTHVFNRCTIDPPSDCACLDYNSDDYGSSRLDYVFVEDPQPEHDMRVDLTRIRRRPFPRQEPCGDLDSDEDLDYDYLSDHLGLDFYLIASPN